MSYTRTFEEWVRFRKAFTSNHAAAYDNVVDNKLTGTRTGSRVPGWRKLVESGQNATSNYTSDRKGSLKHSYGFAYLHAVIPGTPMVLDETFIGFVFPVTDISHLSGTDFLKVENAALTKAYQRIRSETSHMNGLSFLGELRETVRALKHPYSSMAKLVENHLYSLKVKRRGFPKGSLDKNPKWHKVLADTWLETKFGMMPLISDTKAIAESLARHADPKPKRSKITASSSSTLRTVTPTQAIVPNSLIVYRLTTDRVTEYSVQWTVGMAVTQEVDSSSVGSLGKILGLTPENFIPAAWEVMPWSWLIDYFSNVGNIIEAGCTNTTGVTWSCRTTRLRSTSKAITSPDEVSTQARCTAFGWTYQYLLGDSCGANSLYLTTIDRANTPLSIPVFQLSYPDSLGKIGNIAAVVLQGAGKSIDAMDKSIFESIRNRRR